MTPQEEAHLSGHGLYSKKHILLINFLGGLAWGVGSVIGATIVVAILISFLRTINWVPFASEVANTVENQTGKQLPK